MDSKREGKPEFMPYDILCAMKKKRRLRKKFRIFLWLLALLAMAFFALYAYLLKIQMPDEMVAASMQVTEENSVDESHENIAEEAQEEVIEAPSSYYYDQLDEQEKDVYSYLLSQFEIYQSDISVNYVSYETFRSAETALYMDHPEFYWIRDLHTYYRNVFEEITRVEYPMENAESYLAQCDAEAQAVIAGIPEGSTSYQTVKYLYESIINSTSYDLEAIMAGTVSDDQDIRSVLLNHRSVCAGYATTFKYLCDQVGIDCIVSTGTARSGGMEENHAWNAVKLNGQWYWVDVTWGEQEFENGGMETINYNYLCVPDFMMSDSHIADASLGLADEGIDKTFMLPACTDENMEYYHLLGAYFETYDEGAFRSYYLEAYKENPDSVISVRFGSDEEMQKCIQDMITGQKIFDLLYTFNPLKSYYQVSYGQSVSAHVLDILITDSH